MKTDIETRYTIARILGMEDFDFYLIQALDTIEDQYYQAIEEGADADTVFKLYDIRAALLQARNSYADFKNR